MEKSRAPGVPGGPGQPAPGPVELESRSRAGRACLPTPGLSTLPEDRMFTRSIQATSTQPYVLHSPYTEREAGSPTAASADN